MTAVTTRAVRFGSYSLTPGGHDEPDIYGHVVRKGLRVHWEITAGPRGEPIAWGRTFTRGGAWVEAIAAAHRDGAR